MSEPKLILGPMRLPFLVLPPVCVLLGLSTAVWNQAEINLLYLLLAFLGAVASHISVNTLNEYFDFRSGLDLRTQPTPFSGGSGALPARPEIARSALITGLVAAALTAAIGVYFLAVRSWALLPLGLLGLASILAYTSWITHQPLLCLIAPGLGFGTFMVMGTDFVLTGQYSWTAFFASLVPFFLVSNLLLLNQFPDIEADQTVGRRHLPILLGRKRSSYIYTAFLLATYLSIVAGVLLGALPAASLLGLLSLVLAVPTIAGVLRHAEDIPHLVRYLGQNVLLTILTPVLTAVGLFLAA